MSTATPIAYLTAFLGTLALLGNNYAIPLPSSNSTADPADSHSAPAVDRPTPRLPNLSQYILNVRYSPVAHTRGVLLWDMPDEIGGLFEKRFVSYSVLCSRLDSSETIGVKPHGNTSRLLTPLEPGVPYSCLVIFQSNLEPSVSKEKELTFFSKELAPTQHAAVFGLKLARKDSQTVKMVWQSASLEDSRGMPHYTLQIRRGDYRAQAPQSGGLQGALQRLPVQRTIDTGTSTIVSVADLPDNEDYTVQVRVYTAGGNGSFTYPMVMNCVQCQRSSPVADSNSALIAGAVLCLVAMMIMIALASVLLAVIVRAYRRKRRFAEAANERDPIVVREEREEDEYTPID